MKKIFFILIIVNIISMPILAEEPVCRTEPVLVSTTNTADGFDCISYYRRAHLQVQERYKEKDDHSHMYDPIDSDYHLRSFLQDVTIRHHEETDLSRPGSACELSNYNATNVEAGVPSNKGVRAGLYRQAFADELGNQCEIINWNPTETTSWPSGGKIVNKSIYYDYGPQKVNCTQKYKIEEEWGEQERCTETITRIRKRTYTSSSNGDHCDEITRMEKVAPDGTVLLNPAILCSVFNLSLIPPNPAIALSVDPFKLSSAALNAAAMAAGGPRCSPPVNVYPLLIPDATCYSNHFMFPRTQRSKALSADMAAYITAIKALQLSTVTAGTPPFIEGKKLCDISGKHCFSYGDLAMFVTPKIRDTDIGGKQWGYVIWSRRRGCMPVPVPEELVIPVMCEAQQPILQEVEEAKQKALLPEELLGKVKGSKSSTTFCGVFDDDAMDYEVGSLGSCTIPTLLGPMPAFEITYWVPEVMVSVFDRESDSHFAAWPASVLINHNSPVVSGWVMKHFGMEDLEPMSMGFSSARDKDGNGEFELNAHVGPVMFSQELTNELPGGGAPLGSDGRCHWYSTRMDAYQWRTGRLDYTNPAYLAVLGGVMATTAAGLIEREVGTGQYVCTEEEEVTETVEYVKGQAGEFTTTTTTTSTTVTVTTRVVATSPPTTICVPGTREPIRCGDDLRFLDGEKECSHDGKSWWRWCHQCGVDEYKPNSEGGCFASGGSANWRNHPSVKRYRICVEQGTGYRSWAFACYCEKDGKLTNTCDGYQWFP